MKSKIISESDPEAISEASRIIEQGGVLAIPTDTVYGIGASINSNSALERIYKIKRRDKASALPVLVSSLEQVAMIAESEDDIFKALAQKFWPGPLTIVLKKKLNLSEIISGKDTVAVRMPDNHFVLNLINSVGPLAVTSANISGMRSSVSALEVMNSIGNDVDLIIDGGDAKIGKESTIVDCTEDNLVILREGALSKEEIENYVHKS